MAYVSKEDSDKKYPTQAAIEFQVFTAPAASSSNYVHAAISNTSASQSSTVTTGITSPDVARSISVTTGGTTGDCASGNVTIAGTDFFGKSISENLAIGSSQNGNTTGLKAFSTVTSITVPATKNSLGCTFAIGIGNDLGLKRCMDQAGYLSWVTLNGAYQTSYPPVVRNDTTNVSGNTVRLNTAIPGSQDVAAFFVQNFRCLP